MNESGISNPNTSQVLFQTSTVLPITPHEYDAGHVGWVLVSTALVFLMIPGVGYFYR